MLTIEHLQMSLNVLKALASTASTRAQAVAVRYDAINSDTSRTQEWKQPQLAQIRQEAMDASNEIWTEIKARHGELMEERVFWGSPMFVLAKAGVNGFTLGTPEEATVRGQILTELRMQPAVILKLEADGAARERNWARLYLTLLALEEKGERLPNLAALPIPSLVQADEIFYEADVALKSAELSLYEIRGSKNSNAIIALGLMKMRQDKIRADRAAGLSLNWNERTRAAETAAEAEAAFEATIMLPAQGRK